MESSSSTSGRNPGASEPLPAAASSLEDKCPICLDEYSDKAFITVCFHAFCFECVVRAASMTGNLCPLCKVKFFKVIHNVRANDVYDIHKISRFQKPPDPSSAEISVSSTDSLRARTQATRSLARAMNRSGGRSSRRASVHMRRCVYSTGVKARLPATTNGRARRVRDISASFFHTNPASSHRLVPWLNREIEALLGAEHVSFITKLIMSTIERVDLESEEFAGYLYDFLDSRTSHFMYEFVSYAKSPYDMIAYDEKVVYDWPRGVPLETRTGRSSSLITGTPSSSSSLPFSELPSTSSGAASMASVDPGAVQQRLFEELTSEEGVSGMTSTHSSPLQFCNSPIMIHGSSSEEEDGDQHGPLYRDSSFPTNLRTIQNESTDTIANTSSERTRFHGSSSSSTTGAPSSQHSTSLDSKQPAEEEEPADSVDQIELFVTEDDAGAYSRDAERLSRYDKWKNTMKKPSGHSSKEVGGLACHGLKEEFKGENGTKCSTEADCANGGDKEVGSDWADEKLSKKQKCFRKSEDEPVRLGDISDVDGERGNTQSSRSDKKENFRDRSRSRSSHGSSSHSKPQTSVISLKRDKGKGKLGSSLKDDHKKKTAKSYKQHSPIIIGSDSESEKQHHHHYHHHTHKHKHKHKHKRDRHKEKTKKYEQKYSSRSGKAHSTASRELLLKESRVIEEEIEKSKREILKSSLRKERMELLHNCLHGQLSPGRELCGVGQGGSAEGEVVEMSEHKLEAQLADIEKNIVKEKQQLLKVMSSLEHIQQQQSD